jgi:hypothetical protein
VGTVQASAERVIAAPPTQVYALIADYREGRPKVLPDSFADWRVEAGGTGAGTEVAYTLNAARRSRSYRLQVTEPRPGSYLHEADTTSSFTQGWKVEPEGTGTRVQISCSWQGAGGVGGFFERTFAPKGIGRLYEQILDGIEREVT